MAAAEFLTTLHDDPYMIEMELKRLKAQDSLLEYIKLMWPILEPRKELKLGWALECLCEHLEALHRGELPRLMINIPPGMMKSMACNVFFSTWEWGPRDRADLRWLTFSYTIDNTRRDNKRARDLISSPLYQLLWGDRVTLASDRNKLENYGNTMQGWRIASSVAGVGTGERADRLMIDDPHKVSEVTSDTKRQAALEWFADEITTRVNDDGSAVLGVGQRTHMGDLFGLILRERLPYHWLCLPMEFEKSNRCFTSVLRHDEPPQTVALIQLESDPIPRWVTKLEWNVVEDDDRPLGFEPKWQEKTLQDRRTEDGELLWPERFSRRFLEEELKPQMRSVNGMYAEAGQFQQRPVSKEGGLFELSYFNYIDANDLPNGLRWIRGWDLAGSTRKKSPFTVGVKIAMKGTDIYIGHVVRKQAKPAGVYRLIGDTAESDGGACIVDVPQDPGQAGKDQIRHLRAMLRERAMANPALARLVMKFSPESGDKATRASPVASEGEAGNLYLVRGEWNDTFVTECTQFPNGDFSDQVDALSRAYARLLKLPKRRRSHAPILVGG